MSLDLVIAPAAQADLEHVYRHGLTTWRQKQTNAYLERLKKAIWLLAEQSRMGTSREELALGLRSFPTQQHTIYYRPKNGQLEIARILHGRQDPKRHTIAPA